MPDRHVLTVHVLDTVTGRPAAGMGLALHREGDDGVAVERITNRDGRCDTPLLEGEAFRAGTYELRFEVAAWRGDASDPGFYDRITIRFRVGERPGHVHVPLLLAPYGYSTYRGS